ncbi:probable 3',5'-cyclic phosphodiesterase pde-5 isoform X2 [Manduca sexta]|uniref:probable 3',5'-cyclic phosphodiesterase pde-5 isoform X2 n=1 Tax=Manduca sexta TaxID=7130 RepID=UPI001182968B|nr:probable 3',5'-cyclic phosphodiesterase pde-5 isoform X2 [Manduca sexta]
MQSGTPLRRSEVRSPRLLPPIRNGDAACSGNNTPVVHKSSEHRWSRYHAGCMVKHPLYLDWSAVRTAKKMGGNNSKCMKAQSLASFKGEQQENVAQYLDNNKEFLDNYVSERVDQDLLEKWLAKKMKTSCTNQLAHNKTLQRPYKDAGCYKHIFMDLLKNLKDDPNEHTVLWELAKCITSCIGVDAYRVYKLFPDHPTFVQYFKMDHVKSPQKQPAPKILLRAEQQQVALVLEIAKNATCRRLSRTDDPAKFPEMATSLVKTFGIKAGKTGNHVMYQPILTKSGKTGYLIEMWRIRERFKELEEQISSNFVVWGSLALHYCNMYLDKKRERNMSDFLLDVVKAIFEEMVSLDQLIKRILEFAQRLVNADRASLFLVDYRNSELVSTVFDLKFEPGLDRDMEKKEIRMPINRGIAGYVALSGETMNIPDAYSDYRFNREVDEATGYKTISILCMPIKVEGKVIGVVQMVNKRNGDTFGHEDEAAFEIFSTFFGLALHHARLYDRIMRKEQKYRVALEVLSYHNTCKENEVQAMLTNNEPITVDLDNFYLDSFQLDEFKKCKCVITMFDDLFDMSKFNISTMTRFILTVKKNYRTVPYHNFDHGWSVAHAMYVIIKNDVRKRFDYKMRLALFVACICHDLDHRGYTNKYMSETASPLAAMYTTSTLEHHHFNITVTILQQDGHNIFSHITSQEFKEILGFIKHCILATDLAAFFPNLEKIKELFVEDKSTFSWSSPAHRDLAMAISMTAADLSASAKPWEIQIKTVKVIFEEFYDQGDKERAAGREPIPMMDRNKPDEQPSSQVGFLSQICIPCYHMLYRIIPNTKPMYSMAMKNLERWKSRADQILQNIEQKKRKDEKEEIEEIIKDLVINREDVRKTVVRSDSTTVVSEGKSSVVSWDEEDFINDEEIVRSGIWKDIDGDTWIEDDPVLMEESDLDSIKIFKESK